MTFDELFKQLDNIYSRCSKSNWDNHGSAAISKETYDHGIRFIYKLKKHGIDISKCNIVPVADDNLSFQWKYKNSSFIIDFNRTNDTLLWICNKDKDYWNNSSIHFEEIQPFLTKFLNYNEGMKK